MAAFDAAAEAGYPCELDVQLTSSGMLIVLHDADLMRATGVARPAVTLTVRDLPHIQLFGCDQHVPTLEQVIECVSGRVPLLIELKSSSAANSRTLVSAVLERLEDPTGDYALASFDPLTVYAMKAAKPDLPIGQISGLLRTATPLRRLIGHSLASNFLTGPDFISYELAGLPSRTVAWWRSRGLAVLAWPVGSPADERKAREYADNIIFAGFLPKL